MQQGNVKDKSIEVILGFILDDQIDDFENNVFSFEFEVYVGIQVEIFFRIRIGIRYAELGDKYL